MEKKKNGNGNKTKPPWTDDDVEILKKRKHELDGTPNLALNEIWKEIAEELNRSAKGVEAKYKNLVKNGYKNGNGKKIRWTDDEVEILEKRKHELDGTMPLSKISEAIAKELNRSTESVRNKIRSLEKKFREEKLVNELIEQIKDHEKKDAKRWQEIHDLITDKKKPTKLKL